MTKPTKSQRRAISQAGIAWAEAMAQQFRYLADQGKRAESRQRAARGLAAEALADLRCAMALVRSENGVVAVPERPADPLYRPFRVGEAVVGGMVVWFEDADWRVKDEDCAHPVYGLPRLLLLNNPNIGTIAKCRQVLHATALLRIDGKDGGK